MVNGHSLVGAPWGVMAIKLPYLPWSALCNRIIVDKMRVSGMQAEASSVRVADSEEKMSELRMIYPITQFMSFPE